MDPIRVREARLEAGLSLAQVAGDDVSRTFIHFVEQGRSRPSKAVLSLIARRTGKPISYFMLPATSKGQPKTGLAAEIAQVAKRIRGFVAVTHLTEVEQQAMKLVELTMLQGAELTKMVEKKRDRVGFVLGPTRNVGFQNHTCNQFKFLRTRADQKPMNPQLAHDKGALAVGLVARGVRPAAFGTGARNRTQVSSEVLAVSLGSPSVVSVGALDRVTLCSSTATPR